MKQTALVTGASAGIGEAISRTLLKMGYEVYGIGRHFDECTISDSSFHPIVLDLLDTGKLLSFLDEMIEKDVHIVVNNAGCAWYGLHEEMSAEKISTMIRTDLEVPEIIAAKLIRTLRGNSGWIINVASVTALQNAPHAASYASAKAGLLSFSRSLMDENRKYGVRVVCLMPDLTDTNLYRNADFTVSEKEDERLTAQDVADALQEVLSLRQGAVISELVIRPQKNRIVRKKKQS